MSENNEKLSIKSADRSLQEECETKPKLAKDDSACIDKSNPRYQNKMPLVMYLLSIVIAVAAGVYLALDNGANDLALSKAIYDWVRTPGNETFLMLFTGWVALIGGQLVYLITAAICVIIWILSFGNSKKSWENQRVRNVLKYAGVIVLSAVIAVGINVLLKGLFARVPPNWAEGNPNFTAWYVVGTQANPWLTGSFTSDLVTYASVLLGMTYWFNSKKAFPMKIIVSLLVLVYVVFMGLAVVALGRAFLSDAILAAVFTYWITALVGKGIIAVKEQELFDVYMRVRLPFNLAYNKIVDAKEALNYEAVPKYLAKAFAAYKPVYEAELARVEKENQKLTSEYEKAKSKAAAAGGSEPQKPEEIKPNATIVEQYTLLEQASKLNVNDLMAIKEIVAKLGDIEYVDQVKAILQDNKAVALGLLSKSVEELKSVIEKAKLEVMDFTVLISKCELYISYATRFMEELKVLEHTKGSAFNEYMKRNFLYVL